MELPKPDNLEDLNRLKAWKTSLAAACTYFAIARDTPTFFGPNQRVQSVAGSTLLLYAVPRGLIASAIIAVLQVKKRSKAGYSVSSNDTTSIKALRSKVFSSCEHRLEWEPGKVDLVLERAETERDKLIAHYEPISAVSDQKGESCIENKVRGPNPWYRPDSFVELEQLAQTMYLITMEIIGQHIESQASEGK